MYGNKEFSPSIADYTAAEDKITLVVKGNDSVFDRLYVGKKEDADKSKVITGTADTDGTFRFTFDVPAEMKNQALSVVPGNSNNGGEIKW